MTKIITYSLKNNSKKSDQFYADLAEFTDLILEQAEVQLGEVVDACIAWVGEYDKEVVRSSPEYLFDLLVIGVLWRVHISEVFESAGWVQRVLARLVSARKKYPLLKPGVDALRGVLGGLTLHRQHYLRDQIPRTIDNLKALITWLAASGDFKEEVRRLELWVEFFQDKNDFVKYLDYIINFARYFEYMSLEALGTYTPYVEQFLISLHPGYRWREDYIFTGRQRVEYHLYMVGMEIMNRTFRAQFLNSEQKIMFVPPCMANPQDGTCQAVDTPYGARCAHCTPGCQVNQITRYGEKHGIQMFMIPDSFSPLSEGRASGIEAKSLGVVGVSCPVTIIGGGFEMKRLGIPAQGVLLDHCGCSWHWDPGEGVVTEINFRQLTRTLEEDQ